MNKKKIPVRIILKRSPISNLEENGGNGTLASSCLNVELENDIINGSLGVDYDHNV